MRIIVTANGADLEAPASPVFGRCPTYVFVDLDTMEFEAVENPAIAAPGGAGIQAAQFVVERGARAVVTGNVGPNAFDVLQSAGVPVYLFGGGTVRQAAEACKAGQLPAAGGANAPAHAEMGMGRGRGTAHSAAVPTTPPAPSPASAGPQEDEIRALKDMGTDLRRRLAEVTERLDQLEKGS
jgi:predicted Fe-Mo cluster-binding NifX family protein